MEQPTVYADGFAPREMDLMVVDEHPTLLNVTLFPAKVGWSQAPSRRPWQPPWLAAPRPRPSVVEVVGGAGERGDRPYAYSPIGDTPLRWRDGYPRPINSAPTALDRLTTFFFFSLWVSLWTWC
ncbi:hypothetical protein J6590_096286 [Homalodisca vitripennis]|nr:hypothetical protein J6590_096286 [Homalodisca vitripennis]